MAVTICRMMVAVGDVTKADTNDCPLSQAIAICGSMGMDPRKGTFMLLAMFRPPPEEKMCVTSPHFGHTKPLMFSTMPNMGTFN